MKSKMEMDMYEAEVVPTAAGFIEDLVPEKIEIKILSACERSCRSASN